MVWGMKVCGVGKSGRTLAHDFLNVGHSINQNVDKQQKTRPKPGFFGAVEKIGKQRLKPYVRGNNCPTAFTFTVFNNQYLSDCLSHDLST